MQVLDTIESLRDIRQSFNGLVGLVPTMGYLHDGHLSLVDYARRETDTVIATIFVNPTQFGQGEDLASYPRDLPRDIAMLESAGVNYVFIPTQELMYPAHYQTYVTVEQVTMGLEGARRDGHFRGVATVVSKLFNLIQPDIAYFGQKDAQQVVVIRQLVRDLNFPVKIAVCPIVREPDGLAMSSRNIYLSPEERQAATILKRVIGNISDAYQAGERHPDRLLTIGVNLVKSEPFAELDYISLNHPDTLATVTESSHKPMLLSLGAKVGKPRLLDNCLLPVSLNNREDASRILGVG